MDKTLNLQNPTLLAFVLEQWLPLIQRTKYSWRVDERISRQHILPYLGSAKIAEITAEDIQRWLADLDARNFAVSTRNRILYVLKDIFKGAEDLGCLEPGRSPMRGVFGISERRPADISRERVEDLLARLANIDRSEARAIALLALTGASKNEILAARWENYFPERSLLTLHSPAGKKRNVWLNARAKAMLEDLARTKSGPWLFPGRDKSRHITQIFPFWNRIRRECGLEGARLQDLRHAEYARMDLPREDADRPMPIAVIGMAMRFPGKVASADAMWEVLNGGQCAIGSIPEDRWPVGELAHPSRSEPGRSVTFAAGVIENIDQFDPSFFGISPREAAWMDPQQRLLLEMAQEAMDDAGIAREKLAGSQCGVYIGISGMDYGQHALEDLASMSSHTMTGNTLSIAANRLSYFFDLRGPSLAIDTACSSALTAVHQACQALRGGEAPIALAGGVNLLMHPYSFIGFSHASMLSAAGQCRPFDQAGDGYVRGEGGGLLLLKPLEQAIKDGDHIHAVILGSGVNSDGSRKTGLTIPSAEAQTELMREVLSSCGLKGQDVDFVEAHGTGTPVGDPVEAASIGQAYGEGRQDPVPISSAKANFGHLEPASGMVGLIKAILAFAHGRIPPMPFDFTPNPNIDFEKLNVRCVAEGLDLPDKPLLGAVNSFGFGGLNAHILLASPPKAQEAAGSADLMPPLFLSAASEKALKDLASAYLERLKNLDPADYYDFAYAAAFHRSAMRRSLAIWADNLDELRAGLADFVAGRPARDVVQETAASMAGVAFVYSGNGSQWHGMGRQLYGESPEFAAIIDSLDKKMLPVLGYGIKEKLLEGDADSLDDTTISQPLLFVIQVAVTRLMERLGVKPDAVIGHSVGEVAAAWASGALTIDQAIQVIHARSKSQGKTHGTGKMAALALSAGDAQALIDELGLEGDLAVAAANSPSNSTISGGVEAMGKLQAHLKTKSTFFRMLDLEYAFHSDRMDAARDELEAMLADLKPVGNEDAVFVSSVTGAAIDPGHLDKAYWWRNMRDQVNFAQAIQTLASQGMRIFVEIGPHAVLQRYMRENLGKEAPARILPTLQKSSAGFSRLRHTAASIHLLRDRKRLAPLFPVRGKHVDLPPYPWQRQRCWFPRTSEMWPATRRQMSLLGWRLPGENPLWENVLDPRKDEWLKDHKVDGVVVFPAAAYMEMALEGAREWTGGSRVALENLDILRPLVFEGDQAQSLRCEINAQDGSLRILSRPRLDGGQWLVNMRCRVISPAAPAPMPFGETDRKMAATELYGLTQSLGLDYGPAFRRIKDLRHSDILIEADLADSDSKGFLLEPGALDACFHSIAALYAGGGIKRAFLPVGAARLDFFGGGTPASIRARMLKKSGRMLHADFEIFDQTGALFARALDCRFRAMPDRGEMREEVEAWAIKPWLMESQEAAGLPPVDEIEKALPDSSDPSNLWYGEILPALEAVALAGMARLYGEYGADIPHEPYFRWMGALLEREGMLQEKADLPDWRELWLEAYRAAPQFLPAMLPLARTLAHLPEVFEGRLAPGDLHALVREDVIGDENSWTPDSGLEDDIEALARMVAAHSLGQKISILELGESRLAEKLADALAADRFRLVSVSPNPMPGRVQEKLKSQYVDLERVSANPAQWISEKQPEGQKFDVIILRQSLHKASDLLAAMANLRTLLKPGGLLVIAENYPDWNTDVIDGLDPAWWQKDGEGMPLSSRMPPEGWQALLRRHGFEETVLHVASAANGLRAGSFLILAKSGGAADEPEARDWALYGTAADFLDSLAAEFAKGGQHVKPYSGETGDIIVAMGAEDLNGDLASLKDFCQKMAGSEARIVLVTRGGSLLTDNGESFAHDPAQAAIAGLARVIKNEFQDLNLSLVDLAPGADPGVLIEGLSLASPEEELIIGQDGRFASRLVKMDRNPPFIPERCRLDIANPGRLDNLAWTPLPETGLASNEVEVKVKAVGLNFRDIMLSMGLLPEDALERGFAGPTLGLEFSGIVSRLGSEVADFAVGDAVAGFGRACFASHVVTPAHALAKIPVNSDFAAAASLPTIFITAWYALKHLANVRPGESVLIHGGAGGVGLAAIQICRHLGARIFVTAGTPEKRDFMATLGVDGIFDSRSLDFADQIMARTGGVDVVLNSLAGEAMRRSMAILKPFGRFLELGKRDYVENTSIGLRPFKENISYFSIDVDQLLTAKPDLAASLFGEVMELLAKGVFLPPPYRRFAASHVKEAFRTMQQARHMGKIVVDMERLPPVNWARGEEKADFAGAWLVSGGLSGFGLATARHLAKNGATRLVLASRKGPNSPNADELRQEFAALGVPVSIEACDFTSKADVEDLFSRIGPDLVGIVHAAAVFNDRLLPDLDREGFAATVDPKLAGAINLHEASLGRPLKYFALYSSISVALGNPGQGNYVAANAGLEALVNLRRQMNLPGVCLAWGPIGDVGYLARNERVRKNLAARLGREPLTADMAMARLDKYIGKSGVFILANVDWGKATAFMDNAGGRFEFVAHSGEASSQADKTLAAMSQEEAERHIKNCIVAEAALVLEMDPALITPDSGLQALGMDSLMAMELATGIERRTGLNLPAMLLQDGPTVAQLAQRLARRINAGAKDLKNDEILAELARRHSDNLNAEEIRDVLAAMEEEGK